MKRILKLIFILLILIIPLTSFACQPCPYKLNFDETVKNSDLIIIGQKTYDSFERSELGKPSYIYIKISEVLKGQINEQKIKVKSWYGMCGYGIVIPDKEFSYVIFLKKQGDIYTSVQSGCAIKTLMIKDNYVYFKENEDDKNIQLISIDELVQKIGPEGKREKIEEKESKGSSNSNKSSYNSFIFILTPLFILFFYIILIGIFFTFFTLIIVVSTFLVVKIIKDKNFLKSKSFLVTCSGLIIILLILIIFVLIKFK